MSNLTKAEKLQCPEDDANLLYLAVEDAFNGGGPKILSCHVPFSTVPEMRF